MPGIGLGSCPPGRSLKRRQSFYRCGKFGLHTSASMRCTREYHLLCDCVGPTLIVAYGVTADGFRLHTTRAFLVERCFAKLRLVTIALTARLKANGSVWRQAMATQIIGAAIVRYRAQQLNRSRTRSRLPPFPAGAQFRMGAEINSGLAYSIFHPRSIAVSPPTTERLPQAVDRRPAAPAGDPSKIRTGSLLGPSIQAEFLL